MWRKCLSIYINLVFISHYLLTTNTKLLIFIRKIIFFVLITSFDAIIYILRMQRNKTSRKRAFSRFRRKVSGLPGAFSNQFLSARLGYLKIKEAFRLPTCTLAKDFRLQRLYFDEKSVISRKYRNDKAEIQQSPERAFLESD